MFAINRCSVYTGIHFNQCSTWTVFTVAVNKFPCYAIVMTLSDLRNISIVKCQTYDGTSLSLNNPINVMMY